ncbi:MAG: 3-deoxy-7-phosphoheptulonate synthase, partial [Clostridiales bacterium]|nr:3-deoxy-7-phosphoheptulonate synthase [Clostridiales bacterium]
DRLIKSVVEASDNKFLVIVGPCSADSEDSVLEYTLRLAKMQEKLSEKLVIVPRIYTSKPRTTASGYMGMLHQPETDKAPDIAQGILSMRKIHVRAIEETGLSGADEMLYPEDLPYKEDALSYVSIGARSVENQQHRLFASALDIPVGMKNPTSGYLGVMFNAVLAAQCSHFLAYRGNEVKTTGNPLSHVVLRGYVNRNGVNKPNYHYEDLLLTLRLYDDYKLLNPMVIVDTNHSNSDKKYMEQIRIVEEVLSVRKKNTDVKSVVRGLMIESYLEEGCQPVGSRVYGKSITDPCLGLKDTERLLYYIAENM